jgi:DNA-binding IclR family transcriptional regulator
VSQSIERAIDVLTIIGEHPQSPAEISRRLDVHRSTALRIIEALTKQRLVRKLPDGTYGLGPGLIALAYQALDQFKLVQVAHPRLVALSELHDQTVHLAELQVDHIVYVDKIEPKNSVRLRSRIGETACLHTAGVAKAILAYLSPDARAALVAGHEFERFTSTTHTSLAELETDLDVVRGRGWSMDDGEMENYITCLGAPIYDATGAVIAALSVTELKAISDSSELSRTMLEPLLSTAAAISQEMGWGSSPTVTKAKEHYAG